MRSRDAELVAANPHLAGAFFPFGFASSGLWSRPLCSCYETPAGLAADSQDKECPTLYIAHTPAPLHRTVITASIEAAMAINKRAYLLFLRFASITSSARRSRSWHLDGGPGGVLDSSCDAEEQEDEDADSSFVISPFGAPQPAVK